MNIFKKLYLAGTAALLGMGAMACTEESPVTNPAVSREPVTIERGTFAKGADVSWITELESLGFRFANRDGQEKELMTLLRDDCGVNAIRLRVWVNPENDSEVQGWCNIDDVVVKARRANNLGQRVMIDFHFSERWADPGQQYIPAAWADMDLDQVLEAMAGHVTETLKRLKDQGVEPEWVQIGNETRTGMMWPLGDITNGDNFTRMVNAGYDAVKAVCPDAQVIVHVDCGDQIDLYTRLFGKLEAEGGRYDMIGMSLYPVVDTWERNVDACLANIKKVQETYGKPVMLCEVGIDYRETEIASKMMTRLMDEGQQIGLKGIFWWEPEAPPSRGYTKGCFDENGVPTSALDCFTR